MGSGLMRERGSALMGLSANSEVSGMKLSDRIDDQRPIPIVDGVRPRFSGPLVLDDILGPADSSTARYRKKSVIGKGAFGEAYIVERNASHVLSSKDGEKRTEDNTVRDQQWPLGNRTPKLFVAKVIDLTSVSQNDRRYAQNEIMCLARNHHFAIIRYYEHFCFDDEDQVIVIITEFADRGDLYRYIYKQDAAFQPSEKEVGTYFVQLLLGLDYIHRHRMIHRDIKTANIFMTSQGFLKLGDFGFSQQYDSTVSNPIACTFLGTSYYLSPEMWLGERYGKKADIWAAGVVLCELLGRRRPFDADSLPKMKELVLSGAIWLPPAYPVDGAELCENESGQRDKCYISREMREFLEYILQPDPSKRPSASQLLKTPIMQHYLCLFQRHVNKMIEMDDALEEKYKKNPQEFVDSTPVWLLSTEEKLLTLQGIADGEIVIKLETVREINASTSPRMESVIYKESGDGQWKERYLILADGFLTMTLAKGRAAVSSGERSKKVPLETVKSVVPVDINPMLVENVKDNALCSQRLYAFAISTQNSQSILFATRTEEERDRWLSMLIVALNMD